jgi:hypothetical protein
MAGSYVIPNTSGLCKTSKSALSGSFLLRFVLCPARALRCCNSAPGRHREDSFGTQRTASPILTHDTESADRGFHLFQLTLETSLFCY